MKKFNFLCYDRADRVHFIVTVHADTIKQARKYLESLKNSKTR